MDQVTDVQKLQWLTTTIGARQRAMVDMNKVQIPKYAITSLPRPIHQLSVGTLDKLPPELLCIIFQYLTCDDLEALHSCSTGARIAVLAFPQYHALVKHAPAIITILKETGLARSFTITQIYETFTSPLCTTCGQYGGYVFLPSFTRCCMLCAETELRFLPISRDRAKYEFGVKGKKIFDSLPQFQTIRGNYSSFYGGIKYYTKRLRLYSREMVEALRDHNHILASDRHRQIVVGDRSVKAHQRYFALTPLPCFIPKSASIEKGVYCLGCETRAREHGICIGSNLGDPRRFPATQNHVTDGQDVRCLAKGPREQCHLITEQDRLHDSRRILDHLEGCRAAQALLKMKWTQAQEKMMKDSAIYDSWQVDPELYSLGREGR